AIAEQAGEWFIAHQAGPLPAEDRAAFLAWLRTSSRHVEAYLDVARVAGALAEAVGRPEVPLESFLAQLEREDANIGELPPRVARPQRNGSHQVPRWGAAVAVLLRTLAERDRRRPEAALSTSVPRPYANDSNVEELSLREGRRPRATAHGALRWGGALA